MQVDLNDQELAAIQRSADPELQRLYARLHAPTHHHFKGGTYRWVCQAQHTETNEMLVIYVECPEKDPRTRAFARPRIMFNEDVTLPRFQQMGQD